MIINVYAIYKSGRSLAVELDIFSWLNKWLLGNGGKIGWTWAYFGLGMKIPLLYRFEHRWISNFFKFTSTIARCGFELADWAHKEEIRIAAYLNAYHCIWRAVLSTTSLCEKVYKQTSKKLLHCILCTIAG